MANEVEKLRVLKALAVMGWSDGHLDERQAKALRTLAEKMGLGPSGRAAVEGYIVSRPSLAGVRFDGLNDREREALMLTAVHFAYMDGQVSPAEREVLSELASRLGVSPERLLELEEQVAGRR